MASLEERFLGLVGENRQRVLRVCRVYAWGTEDREDLYQEILFQIWRGLPGLKEEGYGNTWLYRIALNVAISHVRKDSAGRRRGEREGVEGLEECVQPEAVKDPRVESLYEAIGKLGKLEKGIVTLFLEEMSYEEIGGVLGMSVSHVGVVLHRAKKKLFVLMKEEAAL